MRLSMQHKVRIFGTFIKNVPLKLQCKYINLGKLNLPSLRVLIICYQKHKKLLLSVFKLHCNDGVAVANSNRSRLL